jgi:DNA-directed RNA polymerase subunit RPC12/RpoP
MSSNHTYGNQYGAECPYCGETMEYELTEEMYLGYPGELECEHCGKEVEVVSVDMSVDVVLGRKEGAKPCASKPVTCWGGREEL